MLRDDDVLKFRGSLELVHSGLDTTSRELLHLLGMIHKEILDAATRDAVQFFSSYYAKHRFVCTRMRIDADTARTLASLLHLSTTPRKASSEVNAKLPGTYRVLLQRLLQGEGEQEHDGELQTAIWNEELRTAVELDTALTGSKHPMVRLIVNAVGNLMQTTGGEMRVISCTTEDAREVRLAVTGALMAVADLAWEGAVLHVSHVRIIDHERLATMPESLCVLEPDVLIDVTDIAECFQQRGVEPRLTFLRRWLQRPAGEAVVLGSIINSCFDDILQHPDKDFEQMFRDACEQRPLACIAALTPERRSVLRVVVQEHVDRLRAVMSRLDYTRAFIEPSFLSPEYGLQGRLDLLLEYENDPLRKTIIELKSGSAPKLGAQNGAAQWSVWRNHEAQIACYHLLLQSAYPGRYGDSEILYSKASDAPLRNVDIEPRLLQEVMLCRNRIVRMEYDIRSKKMSVLRELCEPIPLLPPYMTEAQTHVKSVLGSNDEEMRLYAHMFLYLLVQESYCQRIGAAGSGFGYSALWNMGIQEKKMRHSIVGGLYLVNDDNDRHAHDMRFERRNDPASPSVFRVGDIVVVYAVDSEGVRKVYHGVQRKGSIRSIDARHVVVRLRGTPPLLSSDEKEQEWICEADYMEASSTATIASFMSFFQTTARVKDVILGRSEPSIRIGIAAAGIDAEILEGLNEEQQEILQRAMSADRYFLLQGPPGTGKTSVMLRSMVKTLLCDAEETLLIAAYTNRAVDEICRVVKRDYGSDVIVRMGRSENTEHPELLFQTRVRENGIDVAEQSLRAARVVIATVTFLNSNPELFEVCHFSTAIIDEAGQILEPHLVGILSRVKRFFLIGDEKQLPPVLSMNESARMVTHARAEAMGIHDLQVSLFERLLNCCKKNGWNHAFGMLTHQARMHDSIGDIASDLFYGSKLRTMSERQTQPLAGSIVPQEHLYHGISVHAVQTILRHRCVFIPSQPAHTHKVNAGEAHTAAAIAELLFAHYESEGLPWNRMTLGIITPFRAQIQQIQRELPPRLLDSVVVDTVERFQGSERDIIIISTVVSSSSRQPSIQSLLMVNNELIDRKLNVALTRARERCIILGDAQILSSMPQYRELLDRFMWTESRTEK